MRRFTPLPRVSRSPEQLMAAIRRKTALRKNAARERRDLEIAVAAQIRREMKA